MQKTKPPRKWLPHVLLKKFISKRHRLNQQFQPCPSTKDSSNSSPRQSELKFKQISRMSKMSQPEVQKAKPPKRWLRQLLLKQLPKHQLDQ